MGSPAHFARPLAAAVQIILDIRQGLQGRDWPTVESAVRHGEGLLAELRASQKRDSSEESLDIGMPEECAKEFRLVQMDLEDRSVIAYVVCYLPRACFASLCFAAPPKCPIQSPPSPSPCLASQSQPLDLLPLPLPQPTTTHTPLRFTALPPCTVPDLLPSTTTILAHAGL